MSAALLEAVEIAREVRDRAGAEWRDADSAFRAALERATAEHSLRTIAGAAGMSLGGVVHLLGRDRPNKPGRGARGKGSQ